MNELQKLMDDIREWSDATFGEGQRTIPILRHLIKEVPEAIEACDRDAETAIYEFADCMMLLLDAVNHHGISAEDLMLSVRTKLERNKNRKWGEPDENGVIEHTAEAYHLNCEVCGEPFWSNEAFPKPHICAKCYF
jgi:NTP pyrophosphatase (non-canonical NTP hydrolase)